MDDREVLSIGYFSSLKDDPLHEPLFIFEIAEEKLEMFISSDICGPGKNGKSDVKQIVSKCLEMLYDRHMANRPPQVV